MNGLERAHDNSKTASASLVHVDNTSILHHRRLNSIWCYFKSQDYFLLAKNSK